VTVWPPRKLPIAPPIPKTISTTVTKPMPADAFCSRYGRTKVYAPKWPSTNSTTMISTTRSGTFLTGR
jgi:hypothetical protein